MSFTEKAKIVDGHSVRSTLESTGSKHQYELISSRSAFLERAIHFVKKFGISSKGSFND